MRTSSPGALQRGQDGGHHPDYAEISKLADIWMHPKQGTDAAIAMAMGHVILKEFYLPDGPPAQQLL